MPQPYKLFTIYAREDAQYLEELRGQLRPLEHAGRIKVWSDREINPGVDWEKEIIQNLDTADIILILVSAAYYNSAYIHEKEIKYAISRHERGETKVLPIIVRPCSFLDDPVISRLQVLPTDGKPVTDRRHWQERDDAWLDVVAGLKVTLDLLLSEENRRAQEALDTKRRQEEAARREREEETRRKQEEVVRKQREKEQAIKSKAEGVAWINAEQLNTEAAWENFLKDYPNSPFRAEAQKKLDTLRKIRLEQQKRQEKEIEASRKERERHEAQQRTREEQARLEREAEVTRQREAQMKREREEQERPERLRREQEEAYRRAENAAWQQASNTHDIEAYQTYLVHFPQGEMVREARVRIKELKRKNAAPISMKRYAAIGGGVLALLLAVWLVPKIFGNGNKGLTTEHGFRYINHTEKGTQKPRPGETVLFYYKAFIGDSLMASTQRSFGEPREFNLPTADKLPQRVPALYDALLLTGIGDSATVYEKIDSSLMKYVPESLKSAKEVRYELVLEKIIGKEETERRKDETQQGTMTEQKINEETKTGLPAVTAMMKTVVADYKSGKLNSKLITTASGLKVQILEKGSGSALKQGENIKVHYYGMLKNGTMFDNSFERGGALPFSVGVGQMIPGFDEGAMMLNHGGKAYLFIPSNLGYGEEGVIASIPPNSELIFYIEVL